MLFSGIPHLAMFGGPCQIAKGAPNMAKWGIPEKSIKNGTWDISSLYILWISKKCPQSVIFRDKNLKIEIWAIQT